MYSIFISSTTLHICLSYHFYLHAHMLTTDTVILSHGGLMMMIVTINSYKRKQLSSILNRIHNTSNAIIIIIIMEHKINIQRLLWLCVGLFELVSVCCVLQYAVLISHLMVDVVSGVCLSNCVDCLMMMTTTMVALYQYYFIQEHVIITKSSFNPICYVI